MSNPDIPNKNDGDQVTATEFNEIVDAFPTKLDSSYLGILLDANQAVLVNGEVTVESNKVSTSNRAIILRYAMPNAGSLGWLVAQNTDIIEATSFIIKSLNIDGGLNTTDNSTVSWCIINSD